MPESEQRPEAGAAEDRKRGPRRKLPKKATPGYLERAALFYLDRYATSADNLRQVLRRKVARSARVHGTDPAAGEDAIDALIARFLESGLLDDARYAETRARSLTRRGQSLRGIRLQLLQKGVGEDEIAAALAGLHDESGDPELAAALAYARRRRIGPFRAGAERPAQRERDLAALARRGFASDLVLKVIDAESAEELEDEAEAARARSRSAQIESI